jgi:hypothetical protein
MSRHEVVDKLSNIKGIIQDVINRKTQFHVMPPFFFLNWETEKLLLIKMKPMIVLQPSLKEFELHPLRFKV